VSDRLEKILDAGFAPAAAAIAAKRIPGAVLGVVTRDGGRAARNAGSAQITPTTIALTRDTWFDLASLTKVIATTTTILRLVEQRVIALDDKLTRALPDLRQYDLGASERRLTFRDCLAHRTDLPAVDPLYTLGLDPPTLRAHILQRDWPKGPPVYSDINFILLGIAIERLTAKPLATQTLGAGLSFAPAKEQCAATERCTWRGRVMRGEVHDENAFALGGAAGHAGLFGTVDGVLGFAHGLLSGIALSPDSIAAIRSLNAPTRTLGWEVRHDGWSGGQACSAETVGHTGFTGTGLWIDWARGCAWTLLTNRVHPTRHSDTGIQALRREVGDNVIDAFDRG
jgi:CubicO group peptidase (beta-lactamase class C family)